MCAPPWCCPRSRGSGAVTSCSGTLRVVAAPMMLEANWLKSRSLIPVNQPEPRIGQYFADGFAGAIGQRPTSPKGSLGSL